MNTTWLGHACFCLEQDGYRVVLDPFSQVPGLEDTRTQAHKVLCSHDHFDHSNAAGVTLLAERDCPFSIRWVDTFHDDQGGALRGKNRVHILSAGGVTAVHLGDLGHQLTAEQAAAIGGCDALLVPIGGVYTIDPAGARAVVEQLRPRVILPMHYKDGGRGLQELQPLSDFLALLPAPPARRYDGPSMALTADTPAQIALLTL